MRIRKFDKGKMERGYLLLVAGLIEKPKADLDIKKKTLKKCLKQ